MADENDLDRGDNFAPTGVDAPAAVQEAPPAPPEEELKLEEQVAEPVAGEETQLRDDKGRFIPKDRFDEAVRKERTEKEALANRLREYEARDQQKAVADDFAEAQKAIKAMIKQHTSLLADGELEKASDLMERILDVKEAISERKAEFKADNAKTAVKEEVRYDAAVQRTEADYPAINPEHPDYDQTAVRRVQAYMTGLMQNERMSATNALREAVETILGKPDSRSAINIGKAEDIGMRRKEAAVSKAMDAKSKQPPTTKDVGVDHDKQGGALDASAIMKMNWDDFVKLPESKLSEMRGDFV